MMSKPLVNLDSITLHSLAACEQLDTEIEVVQRELEYHVRRSRAARSAYAPISRLPDETIEQVMRIHVAQHRIGYDSQKTLALSHVCRRWRQVALACPALWTGPSLNRLSTLAVLEYMSRAQNMPLHVDWNVPDPQHGRANSGAVDTRAVEHILSHGTIRSLELGAEDDRVVLPLLKTYAHAGRTEHLEYLVVALCVGDSDEEWLLPFVDAEMTQAPHRLRHLGLYNCHLPPTSFLFHNLRVLEMAADSAYPLTFDDVMVMLRSAPLLEKLELKAIILEGSWNSQHHGQELVLSALKEFSFEDHLAAGLVIMRLMRAPVATKFHLEGRGSEDDETVDTFQSVINALKARSSIETWGIYTDVSIDLATIEWERQICVRLHTAGGAQAEFENETGDDHSITFFKYTIDTLDWTNVTGFAFSVDSVDWTLLEQDPNAWSYLFAQMPRLVTLKASTKGAFHIAEALATCLHVSILPVLECLSLEHTDLSYSRTSNPLPPTALHFLLHYVTVRHRMPGIPLRRLVLERCGMGLQPLNSIEDLGSIVSSSFSSVDLDVTIIPPDNHGGMQDWTL